MLLKLMCGDQTWSPVALTPATNFLPVEKIGFLAVCSIGVVIVPKRLKLAKRR
jgi:hypothetical protein